MGKRKQLVLIAALAFGLLTGRLVQAGLRGGPDVDTSEMTPNPADDHAEPVAEGAAKEEPVMSAEEVIQPKKPSKKILSGTDGFIAGADWEFDGFVAGGQGQEVHSMFVTNDLVYLNVGKTQEIHSGDRVGIYRRGSRIKDPQTGRFIGYEVRRIAIAEVTDKLEEETCSARVIRTNDGIEIGDLVRRDAGR